MKYCLEAIILLLCVPAIPLAQDNEEKLDFYYNFLIGTYDVIGRHPDSNETYTGKVIFKKAGETLEVVRNIYNKTIEGAGKIDVVTADKIKVLRVVFTENNSAYEATYLIHTDLDNYGRMTGYIYLKEGGTKKPGLEALFSDHIYKK